MKNLSKSIINSKVFYLIIVTTLIFAACQKNNIKPQNDNTINDSKANTNNARIANFYSGEEIFEGLFFATGEFTRLMPQFGGSNINNSLTSSQISENNRKILALEMQLKQMNPDYFIELKKNLKDATIMQYDGIIENTLLDISLVTLKDENVQNSLVTLYNLDINQIKTIVNSNDKEALRLLLNSPGVKDAIPQGQSCLAAVAVVAVVVWEAAVTVNVAIVATAFAAVWAKFAFWITNPGPGGVDHELAVAELYNALNTIN